MHMPWKKRKNPNTTILYAILAGAGAGLVVGLMMAPKSGEQMRTDIGSTVDDYLDAARERADSLKSSATDMAQRGLREVQRTKDVITDKVKDVVNKGEKEAHNAIDRAAAATNTAAKKGHESVENAASDVRSGTRG